MEKQALETLLQLVLYRMGVPDVYVLCIQLMSCLASLRPFQQEKISKVYRV